MKKSITILFVSILSFLKPYAQTSDSLHTNKIIMHPLDLWVATDSLQHKAHLTEKEAQRFLERAWSYLKTSDSASFINLWRLDDSTALKHHRPFTKQEIINNFNYLKKYLDTELSRNLKIDHINIENDNLAGTDAVYWIEAWFKFDEHYYRGFGFYVTYKNDKWIVRDYPSTSILNRNPSSDK